MRLKRADGPSRARHSLMRTQIAVSAQGGGLRTDGCTIVSVATRRSLVPELPDIVVYIEALEKRILGERLDRVRIASPFLLRTATPPLANAEGKTVVKLRRLGKRICMGLDGDNDIWLVLHLMIAGRLHWRKRDAKVSPPRGLAAFDFANGTLLWTEAGSQKRASLHVVAGGWALRARPRRDGSFGIGSGALHVGSHVCEPHAETSAHRSSVI